ncbi:MAG: DNA repair protein RecN [Pseudomonadota bacterium]
MLVHLSIKNLTVVKQVSVTFEQGMTAITGETGAGKSIALDALGLCLGSRADSNIVRKGTEKAEVIAHFDITHTKQAQTWLDQQSLQQEDNVDECFIRRVVSSEGKSKAFINGTPATLKQLKALSEFLVNLHGQHEHYHLLQQDNQLALIDEYAEHKTLLANVNEAQCNHKDVTKEYNKLKAETQQRIDRTNLLQYQVKELDNFGLDADEFEQLEAAYKKSSSMKELSESADKVCYLLKDGEPASAIDLLNHATKEIESYLAIDTSLTDSFEMLQNALVQAQESYAEIDRYRNRLEIEPEALLTLEQRYSEYIDLSRKHNVSPEHLYDKYLALSEELSNLHQSEADLDSLEKRCTDSLAAYRESASKLSTSRAASAKALSEEIQGNVRTLNMPHAVVQISIEHDSSGTPHSKGNDEVSFNISVNAGQQLDSLEKVVSGGELSRVGLVLHVIRSQYKSSPTLVFDEVDTGISGQTAAVVGKLLKRLGEQNQIICVTHLPQVAASAQHQLFVNKSTDGATTETQVLALTKSQRVNEIARLLAGDEVTDIAIKNAQELIG